ncbi:MAG: hypothetical protein H6574_23150 [Lewinellaceae bacterium]|nr:hypothetical protein [Lewinellaceae bacterium]
MPTKKDLFQPVIKKGMAWYIEYYIDVKGTRKRVRRSRTSDGTDLNTISDLAERELVAKQMVKEIYVNLCPPVSSPAQTRFLEALQLAVELKHSNKAKPIKPLQRPPGGWANFLNPAAGRTCAAGNSSSSISRLISTTPSSN